MLVAFEGLVGLLAKWPRVGFSLRRGSKEASNHPEELSRVKLQRRAGGVSFGQLDDGPSGWLVYFLAGGSREGN